jgi:hypothetical protein
VSNPTSRTFAVIDGGIQKQTDVEPLATVQKPRLLDQVREAIRTRHYSNRTEKAYVHWIKRFVFFHDKRHPAEMAEGEIARFLSSLPATITSAPRLKTELLIRFYSLIRRC